MAAEFAAGQGELAILGMGGGRVIAAIRFIWNATRGHRLAPWRSPYLRWRIETFSGHRAETLTAGDVLSFLWSTRGQLFEFLRWTDEIEREAHKRT